MPMKGFVDKKIKVGLFDSGIGGFSILQRLFEVMPSADFYYYSDDANAPYGPKADEFITERSIAITKELISKNVDIIVVACNTATAASIDTLRSTFVDKNFVGVEPYLNAYYKMPDGPKKMAVLTTYSTGKSERFKRLKERLDPNGQIEQISLLNMARLIEDFYYQRIDRDAFLKEIELELKPIQEKDYTHLILGCTHYPLISKIIENMTSTITISPDNYVANRVCELTNYNNIKNEEINKEFNFCSSRNNQWVERNRFDLLQLFKI
jgi:glutamate racemase